MEMFGHMKDPVDGTATLVSYTETDHGGHSSPRVSAQVMLHAPGMEAQRVEVSVRVPHAELPLTVVRYGTCSSIAASRRT
jgi:hypothetical protein